MASFWRHAKLSRNQRLVLIKFFLFSLMTCSFQVDLKVGSLATTASILKYRYYDLPFCMVRGTVPLLLVAFVFSFGV